MSDHTDHVIIATEDVDVSGPSKTSQSDEVEKRFLDLLEGIQFCFIRSRHDFISTWIDRVLSLKFNWIKDIENYHFFFTIVQVCDWWGNSLLQQGNW